MKKENLEVDSSALNVTLTSEKRAVRQATLALQKQPAYLSTYGLHEVSTPSASKKASSPTVPT